MKQPLQVALWSLSVVLFPACGPVAIGLNLLEAPSRVTSEAVGTFVLQVEDDERRGADNVSVDVFNLSPSLVGLRVNAESEEEASRYLRLVSGPGRFADHSLRGLVNFQARALSSDEAQDAEVLVVLDRTDRTEAARQEDPSLPLPATLISFSAGGTVP